MKIERFAETRELPTWADLDRLSSFLHHQMKPYEDKLEDVRSGLSKCLAPGKGFLLLAHEDEKPVGALVLLPTGMKGYVPEFMILFVCVDPKARGMGLGGNLIKQAISEAGGTIKLHVEPENPAARLYRRLGFTNKYLEMRHNGTSTEADQ